VGIRLLHRSQIKENTFEVVAREHILEFIHKKRKSYLAEFSSSNVPYRQSQDLQNHLTP
jgi:hypothetical protein